MKVGHTGDLGQLDQACKLYVPCRKGNIFISGGKNISPEEIDHILAVPGESKMPS